MEGLHRNLSVLFLCCRVAVIHDHRYLLPTEGGRKGGGQSYNVRRLEEVAKAVGGGYCRLQTPLRLPLAVRDRAARPSAGCSNRGGTPPPV